MKASTQKYFSHLESLLTTVSSLNHTFCEFKALLENSYLDRLEQNYKDKQRTCKRRAILTRAFQTVQTASSFLCNNKNRLLLETLESFKETTKTNFQMCAKLSMFFVKFALNVEPLVPLLEVGLPAQLRNLRLGMLGVLRHSQQLSTLARAFANKRIVAEKRVGQLLEEKQSVVKTDTISSCARDKEVMLLKTELILLKERRRTLEVFIGLQKRLLLKGIAFSPDLKNGLEMLGELKTVNTDFLSCFENRCARLQQRFLALEQELCRTQTEIGILNKENLELKNKLKRLAESKTRTNCERLAVLEKTCKKNLKKNLSRKQITTKKPKVSDKNAFFTKLSQPKTVRRRK